MRISAPPINSPVFLNSFYINREYSVGYTSSLRQKSNITIIKRHNLTKALIEEKAEKQGKNTPHIRKALIEVITSYRAVQLQVETKYREQQYQK